MSVLELDLNTLAALPNDRTKMALIALAKRQQETQRERYRLAAERQNANRHARRRQWAHDPWVREVHREAKRMLAELQRNEGRNGVLSDTDGIVPLEFEATQKGVPGGARTPRGLTGNGVPHD